MAEIGIDLSERRPQLLTREMAERADVVVTMGCGDACPYVPGKRYFDWDLEDPKDMPIEQVRAMRDDITARVQKLVSELDRDKRRHDRDPRRHQRVRPDGSAGTASGVGVARAGVRSSSTRPPVTPAAGGHLLEFDSVHGRWSRGIDVARRR